MTTRARPMTPALMPVVERLRAEGRRDLGLADQFEVDRQGADLQDRRQVLGLADVLVKPPEIWAPLRPSIPSGFSAKLMIGRVLTSLSRTTAKWPESAAACSAADRADRLRLAALGDLAGDFLEGVAALVGEVEGDVRFVEFAEFLLRVGDVGARERRVVFQREPARLGGFVDLAAFVGRAFGDEDRARRDFDDDRRRSAVFRRSG